MFLLRDPKHFHDLNAVLGCVSVEVIVEDSEHLLGVLSYLFDFGNPPLKLRFSVTVVVPGLLAVPMPTNVSNRRSDVDLRWEKRFVNDAVGGLVL